MTTAEQDRGFQLRGNSGARRLQLQARVATGELDVELQEVAPDGFVITAARGTFKLGEFAARVAYVLSDGQPAGLTDVIRDAYATAGDVVFSARLRGETIDLYDAIAEAICERYVIIEKEV